MGTGIMKCPSCGQPSLSIHCETNGCDWAKCNCGVILNKKVWTKRDGSGKYEETREMES